MIIELTGGISEAEVSDIRRVLAAEQLRATAVKTAGGEYLVCLSSSATAAERLGELRGVKAVHVVGGNYKLVSRNWRAERTVVNVGAAEIDANHLSLILGPCAIESEEQVVSTVEFLSRNGIRVMRGGAFKPRSSPYAFRGLGIEGLQMLAHHARAAGIAVVSEVMENSQIASMYDYVDMYQVGARNMQNFSLLHELGRVDKPVLLKRGISGTIEELLQSAEYVFASGNEQVVLCERGIRTFEHAYRNTLDLNAVPLLKDRSHLPVIVDPSHGVGDRRFVEQMALAAIMAGADGLLVEIHERPDSALSDGRQSLDFDAAERLITRSAQVFELRERL